MSSLNFLQLIPEYRPQTEELLCRNIWLLNHVPGAIVQALFRGLGHSDMTQNPHPEGPPLQRPKWQESMDGSGRKYTEVIISEEPNRELFEYVAAVLLQSLNGEWVEKLTGLDETYWDLRVGDDVIVLHRQHYLGIMVHPSGLSKASESEKSLLRKAFDAVEREVAHE